MKDYFLTIKTNMFNCLEKNLTKVVDFCHDLGYSGAEIPLKPFAREKVEIEKPKKFKLSGHLIVHACWTYNLDELEYVSGGTLRELKEYFGGLDPGNFEHPQWEPVLKEMLTQLKVAQRLGMVQVVLHWAVIEHLRILGENGFYSWKENIDLIDQFLKELIYRNKRSEDPFTGFFSIENDAVYTVEADKPPLLGFMELARRFKDFKQIKFNLDISHLLTVMRKWYPESNPKDIERKVIDLFKPSTETFVGENVTERIISVHWSESKTSPYPTFSKEVVEQLRQKGFQSLRRFSKKRVINVLDSHLPLGTYVTQAKDMRNKLTGLKFDVDELKSITRKACLKQRAALFGE